MFSWPGWQELRESEKGLRWKVWIWTKTLSLNICYFIAILRFVAIYTLLGKKCLYFMMVFLSHFQIVLLLHTGLQLPVVDVKHLSSVAIFFNKEIADICLPIRIYFSLYFHSSICNLFVCGVITGCALWIQFRNLLPFSQNSIISFCFFEM